MSKQARGGGGKKSQKTKTKQKFKENYGKQTVNCDMGKQAKKEE